MGVGWNTARTRHWTRVTARQSRAQTRLMQAQLRATYQAAAATTPAAPPPGWHHCATDSPSVLRWWNGAEWTARTHQLPTPR